MSLIDQDVQDILDDTLPDYLKSQSRISAPLYGEKWLNHVDQKGRTMDIRIRAGKTSEVGSIRDGQTLDFTGKRVSYADITQTPAIVYGKLKMARGEANQTHDTASAINLVRETLSEFAETYLSEIDLGMIYGGIYEGSLTADMVTALGTSGSGYNLLLAATESAPITITVADPGRYEVGQALEFYSIVSGTGVATLQARAIVTDVTPNYSSGTHTVSMYGVSTVTPSLAPVSGTTNPVQICQRGAYESGTTNRVAMLGLAQVCDDTFDLYGYDRNLKNWKPQSHDAGGNPLTGARLRKMSVQLAGQKAGSKKFILLNSETLNVLHEEQLSDRQINGLQFDITDYNQTGKFGSMMFKVDDNVGSSEIFIPDPDDVELGVFQSLLTDGDGAPGKDKGEMHWETDPNSFNIVSDKWAIHQMKVSRRSSSGRITNLG